MSKRIKTIQIAFNLDDPFQKKLYDHIKDQSTNASLYGKMLIQKDMNGSWKAADIADDEQENAIQINEDLLKSYI